jgi:hypothetical protein
MVFALAKADGRLLAFPSPAEAVAHCKAMDVKGAAWLLFADDGSPLEARFERPNQPGMSTAVSGAYTLQRAMSGLWLQERLAQVKTVEGIGLTAVADLVELLKINRSKRVPPGVKRG